MLLKRPKIKMGKEKGVAAPVIDIICNSFSKHMEEGWKTVKTEPVDKKRVEELHPSSFPYCGLRDAYSIMVNGESETRSMDGGGLYYTSVGTIVHTVLQELFGKLKRKKHKVEGYLIGDWHCKNIECKHIVPVSKYVKCPKCRSDTQYEELGIVHGVRTHGHLDGLYHVKIGDTWYYLVIDYKTSSVKAIDRYKTTRKGFPYVSNKWQIRSYTQYLKQYGIKVDGWLLIYIARDKPTTEWAVVGEMLEKDVVKMISKYIDEADASFNLVRENKKNLIPVLSELHEMKLCPSKEFYTNEVHDNFDPCPLNENGLCWRKDCVKKLKTIND